VATAINLLKNGAFDYIVKDDDTKDDFGTVSPFARNRNLKEEVESLKTQVGRRTIFPMIIGKSEPIEKVFALIEKASRTNITVSITGETGSGKEMVAKAIHYNSDRHKQPFVTVNVAAIPRDLIESELFGHEKGAFTGAVTRRIGKFEEQIQALFLEEIELDINLRRNCCACCRKEITRVGSNTVTAINVRIIVATHKNLMEEVKNKTSGRSYYRLSGYPFFLR
jgi:DNA-binding NtrC family response regulator